MSRIIFCLLVWACHLGRPMAFAQERNNANSTLSESDLLFVQHLMDSREYSDAILVLQAMKGAERHTAAKSDSIHLILGRAFYLQEKIDSSNKYFGLVRPESALSTEAGIFLAFGKMYQCRNNEAEEQLKSMNPGDSVNLEFIGYMRAVNALVSKDFSRYEALSRNFRFHCRASEWEQKQLGFRAEEQKKNKRKSPWLAGAMSALLPGSGKFYAGYRGQAIASLIPCLIFGAAGVESYFRSGPKSIPFIASTSLFSLFYLGNIWGSAISVKTLYEQKDREIRHHLLLNVQVTMHRLFRQ